tara:strand:- start:112 stop:282 length:171 start_codon:yes stop_codon:yes gene_type:complete
MSNVSHDFYEIGTRVKIHGAGVLEGLVVDYYDDNHYVVAFPDGTEFVFAKNLLIKE